MEHEQKPVITDEDVETLKARDERWRSVEAAIKMDEEFNNSFTVNLILEALTRRSTEAMEGLIIADPTDVRRIASLQEQINCGRFIAASLSAVREKGVVAHRSLDEEGQVELESPDARGQR